MYGNDFAKIARQIYRKCVQDTQDEVCQTLDIPQDIERAIKSAIEKRLELLTDADCDDPEELEEALHTNQYILFQLIDRTGPIMEQDAISETSAEPELSNNLHGTFAKNLLRAALVRARFIHPFKPGDKKSLN